METPRRPSSSAILFLGLGAVLFAVGGKLTLIHFFGTDQPYADQWAAEGMYFLRGPLYYHVDLNQIIALHGEHRPGLTRLWVLGLVWLNQGQWDCFVELVADLLIYAVFLLVAWRWLVSHLTEGGLVVATLLMAGLFALPCAYENFLWGFQSQFLFLLLFGLLHIGGTLRETRLGLRWWLAQIAGFLGLFSIAAGVTSAAALVAISGVEWMRGKRMSWVWGTLAANLCLLGLGLWLLPPMQVSPEGWLVRIEQTLQGFGYLLAWPHPGLGWAFLQQAPWVFLLITYGWTTRDPATTDRTRLVAAAGLWVVGMAFAIAYGRVVNAGNIGVRYLDVLILGLLINGIAVFMIATRLGGWRQLAWRAGAVIWALSLGMGLWNANRPANLGPMFKFQHDEAIKQRQIVRDFLVSDDPTQLQEFANQTHRFPHMDYTLIFLRDPKVLPLLPPSLTPDGRAGPVSRGAVIVADGWWLLMGAGVLLIAVGSIRLKCDRSPGSPA